MHGQRSKRSRRESGMLLNASRKYCSRGMWTIDHNQAAQASTWYQNHTCRASSAGRTQSRNENMRPPPVGVAATSRSKNRCLKTGPQIEKTSAPRTRAKPHDRREGHKGEETTNDAKREKHDQRSSTARAGGRGDRQTGGGGIKGQDYQPEPSTWSPTKPNEPFTASGDRPVEGCSWCAVQSEG